MDSSNSASEELWKRIRSCPASSLSRGSGMEKSTVLSSRVSSLWTSFVNGASMEKFEKSMAKDSLVIANASIIEKTPSRNDVDYLMVKLGDCAQSIEGGLLNIVTLGYFIKKTQILKKQSALNALEFVSKKKNPAFLKRNLESFEAGYNFE